jgi:hypothetical protein
MFWPSSQDALGRRYGQVELRIQQATHDAKQHISQQYWLDWLRATVIVLVILGERSQPVGHTRTAERIAAPDCFSA